MNHSAAEVAGAREVAGGVFVLTSGAYALNSGIVLGWQEGPALLVDPGYFPGDLDRIAAFLDANGAGCPRIVLTHSDWDHVAGVARWPGAGVTASSAYPQRAAVAADAIHRSLADFDAKLYVRRTPPFSIPSPSSLVGSPSDMVWDGPAIRLLPAGGHTPDGLMVLVREHRVLFAGDHTSDLEIPFVGDSFASYRDTLGRLRGLFTGGRAEILVPGHGTVCGRGEALERIDEDQEYLARLESWIHETRRTVSTLEGLLDRADEVVFRKGWDNPEVRAGHCANIALAARLHGIAG